MSSTPSRQRCRRSVLAPLVTLTGLLLAGCGGEASTAAPSPVTSTGSPALSAPPVAAASPLPAPTGRTVAVASFGAVGDGRTDDTAALTTALGSLRSGDRLTFAAGKTYLHDAVLSVSTPGVQLTGAATLRATREQTSAVKIDADDVAVDGLTLAMGETTKRWDSDDQMKLYLAKHSGIHLREVTVEGSAAAGIFVSGSGRFVLDHVRVTGTRADGIHMTQGAHDGTVVAPTTRDTGDDGVAVVSYAQDGPPCTRIRVISPHVTGSKARGISVVGGTDVTWTDIDVADSAAASVYLAAEGDPYYTTTDERVRVTGGRISGANRDTGIDHGAVLVYNGRKDEVLRDITVSGLSVSGTRASASRQVGIITEQQGGAVGVNLTGFALTGGPATDLVSKEPKANYRVMGWTRDGKPVADPAATG